MFKYEENENDIYISISNDLDIYTAIEFKTLLDKVIDDKRELEINLAEVTQIDCAGIQHLMLTKKERDKRNLGLSLVQPSNVVLDAFGFLRLVSYFNDPVAPNNRKGDSDGA
jgi:anti-sigma B factor antagonist